MNWRAINFDWNHVLAFLATAEEGSLSAAARALGRTQPTLSRQVAALEEQLDVTLFERAHRSMALTDSGRELLGYVRKMGDAAAGVSLAASGQATRVEGHVSVTATEMFAAHHMPAIIERVWAQAPGVHLEVIPANESLNLHRREADIAIRHARPEHGDLIARHIGDSGGRIYASRQYLDRIGRPTKPEELVNADFIGFETREQLVPFYNEMGVPVTVDNFRVYCGSGMLILALATYGLGLAVLTDDMAAGRPDLEVVLPSLPRIPIPVWLITHRELHTSRRIRVVFDTIANYVQERLR